MNDWTQRLHDIVESAGAFVVVTIIGGIIWVARTFFTDRSRLSALEREMQNRTDRHNELRDEVKHGFGQIDRKLDAIVERLMK